jgi:pyrroline-5-carboxylate reductase
MITIGFIGGGRITRIFLNAFRNRGMSLEGISVFDPEPTVLERLAKQFPEVKVHQEDLSGPAAAEIVFLAVHPPVMMDSLRSIQGKLRADSAVVSLAPKITIQQIRQQLPEITDVARMNPSASSYINEGINPVCYAPGITDAGRKKLEKVFELLGSMPVVEEPKIEAYAMISAMGHTYFWFQLQKLKELAMSFGMDEMEAEKVISGMMEGTCNTLFKAGLTYPAVTDLVPVKPLGPSEETIRDLYDQYLPPLFNKIKP